MQTPTSPSVKNGLKAFPLPHAMGWSAIGNVFVLAGRLLVGVLIARSLSLNDFGTLSYLIWLVSFACAIGNFGIPYSTSRKAAIFHAEGNIPKAASVTNLGFKLLGITFLVICFLLIPITRGYWSTKKTILFLLLVIAIGEIFGGWVKGWLGTYLEHRKISVINIISIIVLFVGVLLFRKKAALELFLLAYAISYCVQLIVALQLFPGIKKLARDVTLGKDLVKKVIFLGLEYWITMLGMVILWQRFEIAYLKIFSSQVEIAKFAVASQIPAVVVYAVTFFTTPISQYTARLIPKQELSDLGDKWRFLNKYMAVLSMVPAIFIISNAELILSLLYGTKYTGLGNLLSLLAFSAFIFGITTILAGVILGLGKPRINLLSVLLIIPLVFSLAAIIVPKMGAMGAALTRFVGYTLSLTVLSLFVRKKLGPPLRRTNLIKIVILFFTSLVFASLPSLFIEQPIIRLIYSATFELIAILFALRILKFIESGEKVLAESALSKLPGVFRWPLLRVYNFSTSQ